MEKYLLGIDIGTTNVKSVLFDLHGTVIGSAQKEYETIFIRDGWVEQDPEKWWSAVQSTILQILQNEKIEKNNILALGVSCQAPSMLPVDREGAPLRNALIWMDRRTESQCRRIRETVDEDKLFEQTGNRIDPFFILPKILWYKENEPDKYDKTYKIIQPNGYINFKLTNEYSMDNIHASLSLAYDVKNNKWIDDVLDVFNIDKEIFPMVKQSSDILGRISKKAALDTGLSESTIVITGTVDGVAAAIESGVIDEGYAVEMTGTSSVLLIASNHLKYNKNLTFMQHAVKDSYLIFGAMSTTGASLKWIRDNLYKWDPEQLDQAYQSLDAEVLSDAPLPGKIVYLPYLMGERSPIWDSYARGIFAGISLETKRGELIRAVLEGAAFALRHNLEEARNSGVKVNHLLSVGGGANSDIWMTIKASVLNLPISVPYNSLGAPLGDAILAGHAVGVFPDIKQTAMSFRKIKKTYEPCQQWVDYYSDLFESYKSIYSSTRQTMHKMHDQYQKFEHQFNESQV